MTYAIIEEATLICHEGTVKKCNGLDLNLTDWPYRKEAKLG